MLFADMKGSMELLAERDPEEARNILDPMLQRMMEAVHRYEGTVNQVMGDGIMALFGAPLAHEDHAVRACYAALRMQEAIGGTREESRRSARACRPDPGRPQLRRGGGRARSAATCAWTTARSARPRTSQRAWSSSPRRARSESRATRCGWSGLRRRRAARAHPVRGCPAGRGRTRCAGPSPLRSRLQAAARGLTRFVGRDAEMARSRRSERPRAGQGQVVGDRRRARHRQVAARLRVLPLAPPRVAGSSRPDPSPTAPATPYLPVIVLLKRVLRDRRPRRPAKSARR